MAKDIAKSIHKKLGENTKNNSIRSIDIKDYVVEELNSRNENVTAESYSGYSKNTLTDLSADNKFDSKVSLTQRTHQKEYVKQKDATNEEESKRGLR